MFGPTTRELIEMWEDTRAHVDSLMELSATCDVHDESAFYVDSTWILEAELFLALRRRGGAVKFGDRIYWADPDGTRVVAWDRRAGREVPPQRDEPLRSFLYDFEPPLPPSYVPSRRPIARAVCSAN